MFVLVLFCVCFCHCSSQTYASNGLELAQQCSYALTIASQTLHVPQPQLDARGRSRSKMYAKGECAISCAGWFPAFAYSLAGCQPYVCAISCGGWLPAIMHIVWTPAFA